MSDTIDTTGSHWPFLAAIAAEPDVAVHRLVFADFLEEGGETDLAVAYRWMGRRGQWPLFRLATLKGRPVKVEHQWAWYRLVSAGGEHLPPNTPDHCILPGIVFHQLRWRDYELAGHIFYGDNEGAVAALANALKVLRGACEGC